MNTRQESLKIIATSLRESNALLDKTFEFLDECIDTHEKNINNNFSKIFGFTIVKAKNYGAVLYSIALEGLAQEGSGLIRNLIEAYELMVFYNLNPNRVELALKDKLPTAGKIGKLIDGHFKTVRNYLNDNSSHFSYSDHSFSYLVDLNTRKFRKHPSTSEKDLSTNIRVINSILNLICKESITSLSKIGSANSDLIERYSSYHQNFIRHYSSTKN